MQLNASATDISKESYSELVDRENIEGTPFTIITTQREQAKGKVYKLVQDAETGAYNEEEVETEGDVSFGVLGVYRITNNRRSKTEVRDELTYFSWDVVLKLLAIIVPNEVKRVTEQLQTKATTTHKPQE